MKNFLFLFIALSLLCCRSIKKTDYSLEGLWIGTYAHEVYRVHYPVLLELKPNGAGVRIDFRRQDKDQVISWNLRDSTLTLDTVKYIVKYINENELSLFRGYEVKFQRVQSASIKPDESKIKQLLLHKSWQTAVLNAGQLITTKNYYWLDEGKMILRRDYLNEEKVIDSEYETARYQIKKYGERVFFVRQYSTNEFNLRRAELEQIVEMNDDYFVTFKSGNSPTRVKYSFVKNSGPLEFSPEHEFKVCYLEPLPEYFSIRLNYKGGFREIKKIISENYKAPQNSNDQTGYLKIRFVINCEGKPGRFHVNGYDTDLNPRGFNAEITNQLFHITHKLVDWEMKSEEKQVDCNRFLTFKLQEGRITEVLP